MNNLVALLASVSFILAGCNNASLNQNTTIVNNMTYPVKNISVSINRSANEVYQFACQPENFPKWVAFIHSMSRQGDLWIGKTNQGDIQIKWPPPNEFGILDHQVTIANGQTVNNPMRVITNNKGCEFVFTLFWMPGKTQAEFEEDAKLVAADLQTLKEIMEKSH
jgi:hypothetical protein